jgi:hypothetical protein
MIQPDGFIFPALRKLEGVAGFTDGNAFLEKPLILKDVGVSLVLYFITDNVARLGSRNIHDLGVEVGHEFTAFNAAVPFLNGVFILHFEILALRGNAPAMDASDARFRVKGECDFAEMPATGAENFVGYAIDFLEFSIGLNDQNFLG